MPPKFDITDFIKQKHGRITIIKELNPIKERRTLLCLCDCGKIWPVSLHYIKNGKIKSCGCYRQELKCRARTHGMGGRFNKTTEYKIWASMIQRCTNKKETAYKNYGGRGIKVCTRWRCFENFLHDMGHRPSPELTLDRIDVNGNYEKQNCRWATIQQQAYNKRNSRLISYAGKTLSIKDWSFETGLSYRTIQYRFYIMKLSPEEIFNKPLHHKYGKRRFVS